MRHGEDIPPAVVPQLSQLQDRANLKHFARDIKFPDSANVSVHIRANGYFRINPKLLPPRKHGIDDLYSASIRDGKHFWKSIAKFCVG